MIYHTMIVSFDSGMPDAELDRYLKDIEDLMLGSGQVETFSAQRHIRVPGDDHSPMFIASAVVQLGLADIEALNATFALPGLGQLIKRWQSRYPYRVTWVNHQAL
ncbi:hypothetical protein ACFWZ2_27235 [Streptomyces sp. NPDC059002]|uniref:hypothetical protein n=1 Tax=Streptomyces sp. NPDC059002 TaxID=3346690 RepID=UPI00368C31D3